MPAMTAELTAFLNTDALARAEARTLTNINRRALTLWADGYTVKTSAEVWGHGNTLTETGAYFVTSPALPGDVNGDTKKTYKVTCREDKRACTCECFASRSTCKHLLAVHNAIVEGEQADRAYEAYEETMNFFNGRYDF